MTNHYPMNNATTNNANFDWTSFIATAMFEGGQAYLKVISSAAKDIDDAQLTQDEKQADRGLAQALDHAKRARTNPDPHLLAAVQNWSRKQAIAILREKVVGKPIRPDFYTPFQFDLQQEISAMVLDLQKFWDQEDQQRDAAEKLRLAAKREEAEQAFGAAYPYVIGFHEAVLNGERQRQAIFNDGQKAAQGWADKYGESVREHEKQLEERVQRIQQQERENREHQLALRSLAKWDDKNSFANSVVSTGKNTIGCLIIWLLLVAVILAAIYFAFPHTTPPQAPASHGGVHFIISQEGAVLLLFFPRFFQILSCASRTGFACAKKLIKPWYQSLIQRVDGIRSRSLPSWLS